MDVIDISLSSRAWYASVACCLPKLVRREKSAEPCSIKAAFASVCPCRRTRALNAMEDVVDANVTNNKKHSMPKLNFIVVV